MHSYPSEEQIMWTWWRTSWQQTIKVNMQNAKGKNEGKVKLASLAMILQEDSHRRVFLNNHKI